MSANACSVSLTIKSNEGEVWGLDTYSYMEAWKRSDGYLSLGYKAEK